MKVAILILVMKKIQLTQGKATIIDDFDFERLNQHKRHVVKIHGIWYAARHLLMKSGKRKKIYMQNEILKCKKGELIDHIDGDGLNNQRSNLRVATHSQNMRNSKIPINNTSGYKGVYWSKEKNKWCAQIKIDYKNKHLGYFDNKIDAAKAYNEGALKYHGEFAHINKVN